MEYENKVGISIVLVLVVILCMAVYGSQQLSSQCADRGGVWNSHISLCLSKDVIK